MITHFVFALLHAPNTPDGPIAKLLSLRRKSHLLQAEWYARFAEAGEQERKAEEQADIGHSPFLKD